MILLNLELNKIYGFENFKVNFTYPKKIVNSIIPEEHLAGRERFRYKKAVILMGANATGKTSLGKALLKIFTFINTDNAAVLYDMVSAEEGNFTIDFVNTGYILHRLTVKISKKNSAVIAKYESAEIEKMDSYEKTVEKLTDHTQDILQGIYKVTGKIEYRFAYPEIEATLKLDNIADKDMLLKTFRAVIGTLDPTLKKVVIAKDLKDTFIIRRDQTEIIIQDGKLLNREVLSSGTAEGIDVAVFLASMMTSSNAFYYCDEHFSYIQSDIEKRLFGIMLDRISANEQLIFTTHNTDMLDLNLPKHSFTFLRKRIEDGVYQVSAISASDILKRNTDSIRCAVENDVFSTLPDDSLLDELERGASNE